MKDGVKIINLSRGGLIVNSDIIDAINEGKVSCYITDFPEDELLGIENIICIPHLGSSTPESEENCAVMAVNQLMDFLENGNIKNSINFPECVLTRISKNRIIAAIENVPNMIGQVTSILAANKINISDMLHRLKDDLGYIILDIDVEIPNEVIEKLKAVDGIRMIRVIGRS